MAILSRCQSRVQSGRCLNYLIDMDCRPCRKNYSQQITDLKCILEVGNRSLEKVFSKHFSTRQLLPITFSYHQTNLHLESHPTNQPVSNRKDDVFGASSSRAQGYQSIRWQYDNLI
ncbi:hypothetical protein F4776DRAFT_437012 [Hypoxylon sp. NC0597]|nr:hypothetical protein F4776DRAFT_437012 [Hypoxylon sp. NC0597]